MAIKTATVTFDTDTTEGRSATIGEAMLAAYMQITGSGPDDDEDATDLIADVLHAVHARTGGDPEHVQNRALMHFFAEIED